MEPFGNFTSGNGTIAATKFTVNYIVPYNEKVINYVISSLGFFGNLLVVVIFLGSVQLRKKISNMLIINQSMIDMFASLFIFLNRMFDGMEWPWITEPGPTVSVFCVLWLSEYIPLASMVVSTFNLVAITIERYIALIYPMVYKRYISKKHIWIVIVSVWILGFIEDLYVIDSSKMVGRLCSLWAEWPSEIASTAVGIHVFIIEYFIPICILLFCYTRIVIMIHNQAKIQMGSTQRDKQIGRSRIVLIRTLILVSVGFFLCWTWKWTYALLYYIGVLETFNGLIHKIGLFAAYSNCCINPFIYSFSHAEFRNALNKVFTNCSDGRERPSTSRGSSQQPTSTISSRIETETPRDNNEPNIECAI